MSKWLQTSRISPRKDVLYKPTQGKQYHLYSHMKQSRLIDKYVVLNKNYSVGARLKRGLKKLVK